MSSDWSRAEVDAVTADYFAMLAKELRGEQYSKTEHRRALMLKLDGRTDGSVERKHSNISAVLIRFGFPYIRGYKPLANYQRLLEEVVADRLGVDSWLVDAVRDSVSAGARPLSVANLLDRLEPPPEPARSPYSALREDPPMPTAARPAVNYLEREARNASLGRAGEEFAMRFERARLAKAGVDRLARQVEHVAATQGDGLGFDIRSFETDGSDRLIEVKTTAYGKLTPFFVSKNELSVSQAETARYHLYRLFDFRTDPRLYSLAGALDEVCRLEAVQFSASVL